MNNKIMFWGQPTTYEQVKRDAMSSAYHIVPYLDPDFELDVSPEMVETARITKSVLLELLEDFPEDDGRGMWSETLEVVERYLRKYA